MDLLPIEAAGVSLISPTKHPRLIAGSDESAVRYEQLQTALGEGPCVAAFETDEPISIPNLADDDRFPRFAAARWTRAWWRSSPSRCATVTGCLGALDLYRTAAGALDGGEMAVAQTLADVTTAYLLNAQARQAKTEFVATVSHGCVADGEHRRLLELLRGRRGQEPVRRADGLRRGHRSQQ